MGLPPALRDRLMEGRGALARLDLTSAPYTVRLRSMKACAQRELAAF
jgi:hypothetical protein